MNYNYYSLESKMDKIQAQEFLPSSQIKSDQRNHLNEGAGMGPAKAQMQPGEISHDTWQQQMQLNQSSVSIPDRNSSAFISVSFNGKEVVETRKPCKRSKLKVVLNVIIFAFVTIFITAVELGYFPHTKQSFICRDPKLSYRYTGDTIRPSVLAISCIIIPLLIFLSVEVLRNGRNWRIVSSLVWRWYKLMIIGNIVINLFISEVLKSMVGELRPHFFDTCTPDAAMTCTPREIVENYRCTNTHYSFTVVSDSSKSFPSGHSALAVFTSVYCAVYIYYRFKSTSVELGSLCKPFMIAVVIMLGPLCGFTRITDNRHHWWDVLAGSSIGAISAVFTIYGLAKRFRWNDQQGTASSSSSKLWNGRVTHDNASV